MPRKTRLPAAPVAWSVRERPTAVRRPQDLLRLLSAAIPADSREHFAVVFLDSRNAPMAPPHIVSTGTLNASLVHPREVFAPAISIRCAAIIVAHNHPSGDVKPSGDDLELTERLDKCGELLGIALLDHIIINVGDVHGAIDPASADWTSLRELGWPRVGDF